jgi:hypothetical protein
MLRHSRHNCEEMTLPKRDYQAYLQGKQREYGAKFNAADLAPQFIPYYESQQRIEVERVYPSGEKYTRRGTVGITTGWMPAFLLMSRVSARGSSDVLGTDDRIVRVIR